jgi:hypothetical protein
MLSEEYHSMIIRGLPMILICKLMIKMKKMRNVNKGRVKSREETHRLKYLDQLNMKSCQLDLFFVVLFQLIIACHVILIFT